MILIGEKINGAIPVVAEAIKKRDSAFIKERAKAQAEAGADFIDCCAATAVEEAEALKWLIACIEDVTDLPICLDSASAKVLTEVYSSCRRPGIFNSVSGEGDKIDRIFSVMALEENKDWGVVALLMDDGGIPKSAGDRLRVFEHILEKAREYGIGPERIYIDPVVEMLCTSENGIAVNTEVISQIRKRCPKIHITAAVSNISFHLPVRRLINCGFAVLAMNAGLDSLILDPTDKELLGLVYAAEALLGRDEFCLEYISAYRAGLISDYKKE